MKATKTTKLIALLGGGVLFGGALIPLTSYAESNATVSVSATIPSALSMYIDNNDGKGDVEVTEGGSNIWTKEFELYPGGYTTNQFTKVTVRTNAPQGYSVTLQGVSDGTNGYADLVMGDGLEDNSRISSSDATPGVDLITSTWGVRVTKDSVIAADNDYDGEWQAVPDGTGGNIEIDASEEAKGSSITYVYYGIAASRIQAAGSYKGTVRYTMTANSTTEPNLDEMQNYDCSKLEVGETVYLIDNRDHNKYLVGKLEDEQCWMLQNLRLGSSEEITLYSSDTNISADSWDLPALSDNVPANDYDNARLYQPTGTATIYDNATDTWVDTSDLNKGILYNYAAASAGTITGSSNETPARYDICPKGWHLPSGGSDDSEFGRLVMAYGNNNGVSSFTNSTNTYRDLAILFKPALAGYLQEGSLSDTGSSVYYWSSAASSTTSRYSLSFYTSYAWPADGSNRGNNSRSIRCVAQRPPRTDLSLTISFDESMVEKIEVKTGSPEGETVATISTNGGSTENILTEGQSYYLVPSYKNDYEFFSWANGDGSVGTLSDPSNPTPAYTIGDGANSVTLAALKNCSNSATCMQKMSLSDCPATTTGGTVYDGRTGTGYTVKKITLNGTATCWMTSNLKLPAGTKLTYADSNFNEDSKNDTFTLPTETWTSSTNYYCKPIMAVKDGEYYYNWYAATANPTECDSPTSNTNATTTNDGKSLGDICPKGWRLPTTTETTNSTWRSGLTTNSAGELGYTGYFYSGTTYDVGSYGYWWTSTRSNNSNAYYLSYNSGTAYSGSLNKNFGGSVRCMRTS